MKQRLYIFSDTILQRKLNTLYFQTVIRDEEDEFYDEYENENEYFLAKEINIPSGDKKYIPVENVESIFAIGSVSFNSRFLYFLSQNQIPLHLINYRGNYAGSFVSAKRPYSGSILIKQVEHFNDSKKRLYIAQEFVDAAAHNTLANLKYHFNRGAAVVDYMEYIEELKKEIPNTQNINELMGIEGSIKKAYYDSWKEIFHYPVEFTKRIKNPPPDMINSLISYGNAIVYSICINEIFHTRLNAEIGFLHQPADAKLSLAFDIADIFKPIFTDRAIFKVINKNILSEKDFTVRNGFCRIKKDAKKKFSYEFEKRLIAKFSNRENGKRYSYKSLVRKECFNLINHINDEKIYKAYRSKW